ncbi:MAG: hypothetical protein IJ666_06335 [Ruminococcus sp.]|nr:hypothetical protein [Ruminococcus sp.]
MRDILNVMRFDFLTAKPLAIGGMIFTVLIFGILSMLFSPIIAVYITFSSMVFVIPLQGIADKNGFNKLYGILPVKRKNITRARFIYIFLVHFLTELLEAVIICIAKFAELYKILPNQNSETMQMVKNSFADTRTTLLALFGIFTLLCLLFAFMEMMGQIFGRENEFKIIMITLGILALIAFGFSVLSEHDLIPVVKLPGLPYTVSGMVKLGIAANAVIFVICLLFGEITANKLARREL